VSFNDSGADKHALVTETPLNSTVYDDKKGESYFEQAFIIERKIGAGCFGTVYKVKCKEDNQIYAVKIAKEMYKGPSDRTLKLEEVRKHEFLPPHSNIVRFYKSWEERARLYQAFELCQTSLSELGARQGRLPEDKVWAYMVDLLQALEHLHEHDLVHMDIKPENIFIGMDGICKLGDFGLMIDLAKGESEVGVEGDPCYLAPETMASQFTKACDVFSLGVTLLELATDLDLPKSGQLWHDLRTRGPDPSLTKHLTPELRRVTQLMMSRDPQRRPGVKQLLELPSVRRAVRRRSRQLLISRGRDLFLWLLMTLVPVLSFFLALASSILQPLRQLLHQLQATPPSTPPPHMSSTLGSLHPMDCFSDDETDNTVSSSGSSLAAPLDMDSSPSDRMMTSLSQSRLTSTPHISAQFFSPDVSRDLVMPSMDARDSYTASPMRRPATSPGPLRARARFIARTPGATIGLSPGKRLFFGDGTSSNSVKSPLPVPRRNSDSPDLVQTPATANRGEDDNEVNDDSDEDLVMMKPKSLAATFDYFSDDD